MKFSWGSTSSLTYWEMITWKGTHLEHHPATALSFQVTVHLEILTTLLHCCSSPPSRVPGQGWAGGWGRRRTWWRPGLPGCRGKMFQHGESAWSHKSSLSSPRMVRAADAPKSRQSRDHWNFQEVRLFCQSTSSSHGRYNLTIQSMIEFRLKMIQFNFWFKRKLSKMIQFNFQFKRKLLGFNSKKLFNQKKTPGFN